ncbi:MAG TPA: NAD(P)-dependent oxidoreductase [Ktedonobacterales bacterium]
MRTLIVGAAGFLGRNALLRFPHQWDIAALYRPDDGAFESFIAKHVQRRVHCYPCDLTDAAQVDGAARAIGADWDQCLFLAANTSIPESIERPDTDLKSNTLTLLNVLMRMRIGHLVFLSSGAVYYGRTGLVGPETPVAPTLPYAISKLASEQYVRAWRERHDNPRRATIVRFFGAYGPHEPARKLYTKVTRRFAFERNPKFVVTGDGENLIDAMYVDDAIAALRATLDKPPSGAETVDLGVGAGETVNSVVERAARVFGLEARITHEGAPPEYIEFRIDPERFVARYGVRPRTSLEDGLSLLARNLAQEDEDARL